MISIHVKRFAGEIIFWHQKFPFFSTFKIFVIYPNYKENKTSSLILSVEGSQFPMCNKKKRTEIQSASERKLQQHQKLCFNMDCILTTNEKK